MFKMNLEQKVHYTLRIAAGLCFIGHGAFGIITKSIWCNYFAVFGIGQALSFKLMPFVGTIDIICGLLILFYPIRAVVLWLVMWGFVTALLRPLSGEPFFEFIERFGNFGTPLALLILSPGVSRNFKKVFLPIKINTSIDEKTLAKMAIVLRFVVFFLFLGHGCLNLLEKKSLLDQYLSLGFIHPANTAQTIGIFEIIAALSVLIRPFSTVLLILFFWKISTELFYPHYEFFECIERAGSYGAILALWFVLNGTSASYKFRFDSGRFFNFLKLVQPSKNRSLTD